MRDLDRLQGAWNIVSLEMDGRHSDAGNAWIVVSGDRFSTAGMGAVYSGTILVDETAAPRTFDLRFEDGPEKGNTSLGIYQLDGDSWKICLSTRAARRPETFAAPAGSGFAIETLRRGTAPLAPNAPAVLAGEPAPELAGVWTPLSLVRDGQALPKSMLQYGRRMATPGEVTVKFGPDVVLSALYAVDRSRTPMTMDYLLLGGQTQFGIWTFENQRLTTCFAAPGHPRPADFSSTPGDARTLTVWVPAAG